MAPSSFTSEYSRPVRPRISVGHPSTGYNGNRNHGGWGRERTPANSTGRLNERTDRHRSQYFSNESSSSSGTSKHFNDENSNPSSRRMIPTSVNGTISSPMPFGDRAVGNGSKESAGSERDSARGVGAGLHNLGNTCYMNAVLQSLTHTKEFLSELRKHAEHSTPEHTKEETRCMLCLLIRHTKLAMENSGGSFHPFGIHKNLASIGKELLPYRQEDAHEFLRLLLDACDTIDSKIINLTFGGKLRTVVTCSQCSTKSGAEDPIQDLSLEIDGSDICSVEDAVLKFTSAEILEGENAYHCDSCERKVQAEKRIVLADVPSVVVIQLKRFQVQSKIGKFISFSKRLRIASCSNGKYQDVSAELYCVIVHSGDSKTNGHYYCYVKSDKGAWFWFNDASVERVSWRTVSRDQAYLLFYRRESPSVESTPSTKVVEVPQPAGVELPRPLPQPQRTFSKEDMLKQEANPQSRSDHAKEISVHVPVPAENIVPSEPVVPIGPQNKPMAKPKKRGIAQTLRSISQSIPFFSSKKKQKVKEVEEEKVEDSDDQAISKIPGFQLILSYE